MYEQKWFVPVYTYTVTLNYSYLGVSGCVMWCDLGVSRGSLGVLGVSGGVRLSLVKKFFVTQ